jgi:hypothetical protein
MTALDDPGKWRQRAEEMRKLAAAERDAEIKKTLEQIAADYDRLADRATGPAPPG